MGTSSRHRGLILILSLVAISILLSVTIRILWMGESDDLNVALGLGELGQDGIVVGNSVANNDSGLTYWKDYYVCINGLNDSSLQLFVYVNFENLEAYTGYFRLEPSEIPPAGWVINPSELVQMYFGSYLDISFPINRSNPSSIVQGESIEQINLAVRGYIDQEHTNLRSQFNFTVTYYFIDHTSLVWAGLEKDTFDAGSTEGWTGLGLSVSPKYYLSSPYSLKSRVGASSHWSYSKSFQINYSEAYLICKIVCNSGFSTINVDGKTFLVIYVYSQKWTQLAIPLGPGSTTVSIFGRGTSTHSWDYEFAYMDDASLIAK